jgi:hypothetical protein
MNKKLFEEIKEGLDSITEETAEKLLNSISNEKKDMLYRILRDQYVRKVLNEVKSYNY